MSTASQGRDREYKVRDDMKRTGWWFIMRAAASKGPADLLMAHPFFGPALIQVGTPNKSIGPVDRERFLAAAKLCCALAILATAGDRKPITYWEIGPGPASTWTRWEP